MLNYLVIIFGVIMILGAVIGALTGVAIYITNKRCKAFTSKMKEDQLRLREFSNSLGIDIDKL